MQDTDRNLHQVNLAIQGLNATACASALRFALQQPEDGGAHQHLRQMAILASTSDRAQSCLAVVADADAAGDVMLAESAGLQALSLMNRMAQYAHEAPSPSLTSSAGLVGN